MNNNIPVTGDGKWIVQHEGFERHVAPPPVEQRGRSGAGLDVDRLLQSLIHWRWLILGCVLAGMLLGLLAAMATTPMYRATVTLEVNPVTVEVTSEKDRPQAQSFGNVDLIATQVGLLTSRATAERVAQELNLANNSKVVGQSGNAVERLRRATDAVAGGIRLSRQ